MRHRETLLILLVTLALVVPGASPAAAQQLPSATITTAPSAPAPGDPVVLKLSGQWPDSCVPDASRARLTRAGQYLQVNLGYSGIVGPCLSVIRPWSLEIAAGPLPGGTYKVAVTFTYSLMPARTIGTAEFEVKEPQATIFWVPGFSATGAAGSLASTLSAYNNSGQTAVVTPVGAWDALGERTISPEPVSLAAGAGATFDTRSLRPGQTVQMLAFSAATRMPLRATLERLESVPEGLPKPPMALGRVELPVFKELVPAGMTAVAGDISFSAEECASEAPARRRINLTVFNSGDSAASFVVGTPNGPGLLPYPMTFQVPGRSLVQFNDLPSKGLPVCSPGGAFVSVTADQPFLAYVSTSRPETVPGVLPYEIFPASLGR
ncbi:MAG: hypothetical protein IPN83_26170 [Holophagales bacterium]|jgi:hypothetical protein|nr:hypothetical protein [Holophagales bacterium]